LRLLHTSQRESFAVSAINPTSKYNCLMTAVLHEKFRTLHLLETSNPLVKLLRLNEFERISFRSKEDNLRSKTNLVSSWNPYRSTLPLTGFKILFSMVIFLFEVSPKPRIHFSVCFLVEFQYHIIMSLNIWSLKRERSLWKRRWINYSESTHFKTVLLCFASIYERFPRAIVPWTIVSRPIFRNMRLKRITRQKWYKYLS